MLSYRPEVQDFIRLTTSSLHWKQLARNYRQKWSTCT